MQPKPVSPQKIMQLTSAHWALQALAVAVDLSVFTTLGDRRLTAAELSGQLHVPQRSLERLLDANAALGFLEKADGAYGNTDVAAAFLVQGRPAYLGDYVKMSGIHGFARWTRFKECVLNDAPLDDIDDHFRNNAERMQYFIRAMHNNAVAPARFLAALPELQGRTRFVDLGGGSGVYCITLAQQHPDLRATLVDFPPACSVAREYIAASPARHRIDIVEADVLDPGLDVRGDAVLISQVLHGISQEQCRRLLALCHERTLPNGVTIVHEFVLDDDRSGPVFPALFALNMMMSTPGGNAWTKSDITSWLTDAGFRRISYHPTPGPSTFIIGHRV